MRTRRHKYFPKGLGLEIIFNKTGLRVWELLDDGSRYSKMYSYYLPYSLVRQLLKETLNSSNKMGNYESRRVEIFLGRSIRTKTGYDLLIDPYKRVMRVGCKPITSSVLRHIRKHLPPLKKA